MEYIPFEVYEGLVGEIAKIPYNGRFSGSGVHTYKRHPGQIWRPISWCDKCKADITGGLVFDEQADAALCLECAGLDKIIAASLGILID